VIPVTPKMRLNYVIVNYVVRMHARAPAPGRLDGVQQHKVVYIYMHVRYAHMCLYTTIALLQRVLHEHTQYTW